MSTLKIVQTTHDGRKKVWKVDGKKSLMTFGTSRKSDFGSIDRASSAFDAVIENRADGWHFISFDLNQKTPDIKITNQTCIDFAESKLQFEITEKNEFVLQSLEAIAPQKTQNQVLKKILVVSQNNKILKTEVKNPKDTFKYSIAGVPHTLPFHGSEQWEHHCIENFQFKSKLVHLNEVSDLEKAQTENLVDKESKKMLIATLASMFIFVSIGILNPKAQLSDELVVPQTSSSLVVKFSQPQKKSKSSAAKINQPQKTQPVQNQQAQQNQTGGSKVNALLKGAVGVRISQLMGKVSATEARTAEVLVASQGRKADEGQSGRALAAVGKIDSSGRNWNGEATTAGSGQGIGTAGIGAGKGIAQLGQGLSAGKTGSGGVGLIEEESEVIGGLDREVIAQYIKSQLGQILYCYERQLSANPELYGKVAVKFTISGNGLVESQAINQTTLKSVPVEGCILSKISKWKFPEPKGGTKVVVTYPFLFKSTN